MKSLAVFKQNKKMTNIKTLGVWIWIWFGGGWDAFVCAAEFWLKQWLFLYSVSQEQSITSEMDGSVDTNYTDIQEDEMPLQEEDDEDNTQQKPPLR